MDNKVEYKICKKCGINKEIDKFKKFKSSNGKYYYTGDCKQCRNLAALDHNRQYRLTHKKEIAIVKQKNYQKNKDEIRAKQKKYYEENKEIIKERARIYNNDNKEKIAILRKQYYILNRETILKEKYKYKKDKLQTDPMFKIKEQVRNMIRTSFRKKGLLKSKKTEEILGCNLDFFYKYLLKTFYNNYGYEYDFKECVEIDHIKPLKLAKTEQDVIDLCNYTNLQLLKSKDNLEKSDNLNWNLKRKEKEL